MADDRVKALRSMAHPVRLRILSLLTGSAMSAADVARELEITHANASYHLRCLLDAGRIEEAGEERIRGGVARLYRYPHERDLRAIKAEKTRTTDRGEELLALVRASGSELERRLLSPGVAGVNNSDLDGWVAPDAWARARALLLEASALLHDANRPPRTEGTVHVSFTTWSFELGSSPAEDGA
jgi:DNA-binding transcriptional ArsR family regulator